jgi:LPXTG-motif cell wall-anchored protein
MEINWTIILGLVAIVLGILYLVLRRRRRRS